MPSSLISTLARQRARMPGGLLDDTLALVSLAEVLDAIPDPRRRRGCIPLLLAGHVRTGRRW
jgi:hypothetical protein